MGAAARRSAAECRGVWRGGLRAPCGGPSPAAMFGMLEAGASGAPLRARALRRAGQRMSYARSAAAVAVDRPRGRTRTRAPRAHEKHARTQTCVGRANVRQHRAARTAHRWEGVRACISARAPGRAVACSHVRAVSDALAAVAFTLPPTPSVARGCAPLPITLCLPAPLARVRTFALSSSAAFGRRRPHPATRSFGRATRYPTSSLSTSTAKARCSQSQRRRCALARRWCSSLCPALSLRRAPQNTCRVSSRTLRSCAKRASTTCAWQQLC